MKPINFLSFHIFANIVDQNHAVSKSMHTWNTGINIPVSRMHLRLTHRLSGIKINRFNFISHWANKQRQSSVFPLLFFPSHFSIFYVLDVLIYSWDKWMNIWDRNNQEVSITLENQTSGLMIGRPRSLITGNDRNDLIETIETMLQLNCKKRKLMQSGYIKKFHLINIYETISPKIPGK